jgi:CrcB protein
MIRDIVIVGIGSGIGGICRYLISLAMNHAGNGFPWGTFAVNVAGCLLIGILWGVTSRFQNVSPSLSLFLMVGFCGGFTTFSTFSKEGLTMLQANNYILFSLYAIGSVVLGIMAVALGYKIIDKCL